MIEESSKPFWSVERESHLAESTCMTVVSHEHEFIFLKTHKTAGTSLEGELAAALGEDAIVTPSAEVEGRNHEGIFNPLPGLLRAASHRGHGAKGTIKQFRSRSAYHQHMHAVSVRDRVGRRVWGRYFKFAFERNPYDKAVSWYWWTRHFEGIDVSLDEFIHGGYRSMTDWPIYAIDDEVAVDFIGRFENLQQDVARVAEKIGLQIGTDTRHKSGIRPEEEELRLSERSYGTISRVCAREIAEFGYSCPAHLRPAPDRPGK